MGFIEDIKNISILDYAKDIGFTLIQRGHYFSLKEHDSVRIDPEKNCFWRNSSGATGSVIDFSIEFGNAKDASEAISILKKCYGIETNIEKNNQHQQKKQDTNYSIQEITGNPKALSLPPKANENKAIYMYLVHKRGIDIGVFKHFEKRGNIYQDEKRNCVFVGYDKHCKNKPVFASLRGTGSMRFVQDLPGCDYNQGLVFRSDNDSANNLVVCESAIDSLSFMSLIKKTGVDYKKIDYIALNGVGKMSILYNFLDNNPRIKTILLALDNDLPGKEAAIKAKQHLKEIGFSGNIRIGTPKEGKDWNEALIITKKQEAAEQPPPKDSESSLSCHTSKEWNKLINEATKANVSTQDMVQDSYSAPMER